MSDGLDRIIRIEHGIEREVGWTTHDGLTQLFWQFSTPSVPKWTNERRLAYAIDEAMARPGVRTAVVYCHPATAANTTPPDGVTLVGERGLREGVDYRFERKV